MSTELLSFNFELSLVLSYEELVCDISYDNYKIIISERVIECFNKNYVF